MIRRRNNLGVLEINPYWGTSTRCFPSTSEGLSERSPTFDPATELTELRNAWTDLYGDLSSTDRATLTDKAGEVAGDIERIKKEAGDNLKEWETVVGYGQAVDWDLGDEIEGRRFGEHWDAAGANLRILGVNRREVFFKIDQLMVYAPTKEDAGEMCKLKHDALTKYQAIVAEITPFHRAISDGVAERLAEKDSMMELILALFQGFVAILEKILAVILGAFKVGFFLIRWAKVHPKIATGVGLVLGLAILGILLRPYFTILQAVIPGI